MYWGDCQIIDNEEGSYMKSFKDKETRDKLTAFSITTPYETYALLRELGDAWKELESCIPSKEWDAEKDINTVYTREVQQEICNNIKIAMQNYAFRDMLHDIELPKVLYRMLHAKYEPLTHDLYKLADAPIDTESSFLFWLEDGLKVDLMLISECFENKDKGTFIFTNPCTFRRSEFSYEKVCTEERLRTLYDAWVKLLLRWRAGVKDRTASESLYDYLELNTGNMTEYTRIWYYLTKQFGLPNEIVEEKTCSTHYKFSSYKLSEFREYFSVWTGSVVNFFCGDDIRIGFDEEMSVLARAIEAKQKGEDSIIVYVLTDRYSGDEKPFRFKVDEILNPERLEPLKEAVVLGMKIVNNGAYTEEDEKYATGTIWYEGNAYSKEHLSGFQFGGNNTMYNTVYNYLLGDTDRRTNVQKYMDKNHLTKEQFRADIPRIIKQLGVSTPEELEQRIVELL